MKTYQQFAYGISSLFQKNFTFDELLKKNTRMLYAGDVPDKSEYENYIGLSIGFGNRNHIKHNVLHRYNLPNNCIDRYQSEDVFEHIEYHQLLNVFNEIYRILKPGCRFRLSMPDYRCDLLINRTLKDEDGNFIFDSVGGGAYINGKVVKGGHMWFPTYEKVKDLIESSNFESHEFYHYYDIDGSPITKKINYDEGFVMRTPDFDSRVKNPYRPLSIVVDCFKQK